MLRGARVGTETVSLSRTGNGWLLSGSGGLGPPFDVVTNRFEVTYGTDWQPARLTLQGTIKGESMALATTFGLTTAMNDLTQGMRRGSTSHQIASRSVVLPSGFFSAYEGLAARLADATVGTRVPVYVAPEGETSVVVDAIAPQRISLGSSSVGIRVFTLALASTGGRSLMEIWIDDRGRLARLEMPEVSVVVIRDDLASVMARTEHVRHPGDEDLFVPANGFSLGATFTTPPSRPTRDAAAVVLVSSPGPQDRDFTTYGVPIFGQLASALADAGYFVVRYDGRGVGRSGGRTENATLEEYADDVVRVVSWLRRRDDIHDDRISVIGYADGGPVALLAAAREDDIKAVALLNAPGRSGREVTVEQQRQVLARLKLPEAERAARQALQYRVIDAAVTGKGWETIPPEIRNQANTNWFRSWLLFEPAAALRRMDQPLLILHGALDTELPPAHADQLATLSIQRDDDLPPAYTKKVILPAVNHLLVPARTGDVDEYSTLDTLTISPEVSAAIATWLGETLPPPRR
jgi:pimeloyl-ACP methyl ester carboxylesterase